MWTFRREGEHHFAVPFLRTLHLQILPDVVIAAMSIRRMLRRTPGKGGAVAGTCAENMDELEPARRTGALVPGRDLLSHLQLRALRPL